MFQNVYVRLRLSSSLQDSYKCICICHVHIVNPCKVVLKSAKGCNGLRNASPVDYQPHGTLLKSLN